MSSPRLIYSIYENRLRNKLFSKSLPKHIGLIHDGHRRYARKEGLLSFKVLLFKWFLIEILLAGLKRLELVLNL